MTSRCSRCSDAVAVRAAAKVLPDEQSEIEHRGHHIFFVPADRSWYYREGEDGSVSKLSYRSAFQARRAVDEAIDHPAPAPVPAKKKR